MKQYYLGGGHILVIDFNFPCFLKIKEKIKLKSIYLSKKIFQLLSVFTIANDGTQKYDGSINVEVCSKT